MKIENIHISKKILSDAVFESPRRRLRSCLHILRFTINWFLTKIIVIVRFINLWVKGWVI